MKRRKIDTVKRIKRRGKVDEKLEEKKYVK